jgi:hypothetical protein
MYNLYTDKADLFECTIKLEGASIKNSNARIIIESEDINLIFYGTIDEQGNCKIPIKKLKNYISEGITGKLKLEVIADDTFFSPWQSDFEVKVSKSVQVEIKSQTTTKPLVETKSATITSVKINDSKPEVKQKVVEPKPINYEAKNLAETLHKQGVTKATFNTNKKMLRILNNYMTESRIKNKIEFLKEIKSYLKN